MSFNRQGPLRVSQTPGDVTSLTLKSLRHRPRHNKFAARTFLHFTFSLIEREKSEEDNGRHKFHERKNRWIKKMKEKTRDNRKWDPTAGNLEEK